MEKTRLKLQLSFELSSRSTKLIQILVTFSKEERKSFKDFLASPYFNKQKDVQKLYSILHRRKDIGKTISAERVIRKLFPEKYKCPKDQIMAKDFGHLRTLMSALKKQAENFILEIGREKDKEGNSRVLSDELMLRKLYSMSRKVQENGLEVLTKQNLQSPKSLYDEFRFQEVKFYLDIILKNRSDEICVMEVIKPLRYYLYAIILRYCCAAVNQARVINKTYDLAFEESIVRMFREKIGKGPALTQIYYCIFMFLKTEKGEPYFDNTKSLIQEAKKKLNHTELRQIFNFMVNFCTAQIRKGKSKYSEELFQIYHMNINTGIWNKGLYLSNHHFNVFTGNIIMYGTFDVARQFIETYKEKLDPSLKENMANMAFAKLYFAHKNFQESTSSLEKFKNKEDSFYKLNVKVLEIKLCYEKGKRSKDLVQMEKELRKLDSMLRRNTKISKKTKIPYSEFRIFSYKIYKHTIIPKERKKTPVLIQKINSSSNLVERQWLIEKAEELL